MSSKDVAKGKSPLQGNKNMDAKSAIQQKLLTARVLCGFYEDYYKGSINTGQRGSQPCLPRIKSNSALQDPCASFRPMLRVFAKPSSKPTRP